MEVVRLLRNIFLRTFVVGAGFGLLFALAMLTWWDAWIAFVAGHFHTDAATLTPIALQIFSQLRFFLWFGLLTPGLALHWTLVAEAKRAIGRNAR